MATLDTFQTSLVAIGGFIIVYVLLKAIGQSAAAAASADIIQRREAEAHRHAEDAAAEAAGRAAALEPLALNADGSIEEPILAVAEVS